MKHVKLYEDFVTEGIIFNNETLNLEDAMVQIKQSLVDVLPYSNISKGAFGKDTIFVLACFEPKSEWNYGIMENSNYFRMSIYDNGKMEVFTQSLYPKDETASWDNRLKVKFRKSTAKSIPDAISRLHKFIDEVKKVGKY